MNFAIAVLRALATWLRTGSRATFSPTFFGRDCERWCDRCGQRQFVINGTWQSVGAVRNRRCGCRFENNKDAT
jgi:hypothetical protein